MINRLSSLRFNLLIAAGIYLGAMALSFIVFFILNIQSGELAFNTELGGWLSIFLHNITIDFWIILGGVLFSIPTFVVLAANGFVGGFYVAQSIILGQSGQLLKQTILHGLFEIPATMLSAAVSLQISHIVIKRMILKEPVSIKRLKLPFSILAIIALTFFAAIIEGALW